MKRIIEGKAYNTETATRVATAKASGRKASFRQATVYVSPTGMFFIHYEGAPHLADASDHGAESDDALCLVRTRGELEEFRTETEAHSWRVIDTVAWEQLGAMIAGKKVRKRKDEQDRAKVSTQLRLTRSLKDRLDAAAKSSGMSTNAFILRTLENTLAE